MPRENYKVIISDEARARIDNDQCPSCGQPKILWHRRKDWRCCSRKCTEKFNASMVTYSWPEFRAKILARDKYTCVKCGHRPTTVHDLWADKKYIKKSYGDKFIAFTVWHGKPAVTIVADSELIADHIVPIAMGGPQWDEKNVQTLCLKCNKIKTKKDIGNIARFKKVQAQRAKHQNLTESIKVCKPGVCS